MIKLNNPSIFGYTLGCRLNSYETDALVEELVHSLGGSKASGPDDAGIIIVNTCAVTGRSQARSRKAVRSYLSRNPEAHVIVTGCVAQVSPDDFTDLGSSRVTVVPNTEKSRIASLFSKNSQEESIACLFPNSAPLEGSRTRAFLKIQDGCRNRCSYCIVPLARGDSRSQPRELVISQAKALAKAGYKEICLTGVDIADYGRNTYSGYGLPELMKDILDIGGFRLRVGSVEPLYLTVGTLKKMALPGVCRHFHIPFQSGSDHVLKQMGRTYGKSQEKELLSAIEELFPGACIGSDVIAGFPGETEKDFHDTLELAEDPRINYLHVFPFSPRPGTPAASFEQLHTEIITERAVLLRKVSAESRKEFRKGMMDTIQTVLVEGREVHDRKIGLTDNYIPVYAPKGSIEGSLVKVKLSRKNIVWGQR